MEQQSAVSHHVCHITNMHGYVHGSSPRAAFPIMIHPRAITNLRFRGLPHIGFREPTVVR